MVDTQQGLTRRQALQRGAVVGGALLWTAPAAQVLTMTAASAADASGQAVQNALSNFSIIVTFVQAPPGAGSTWETGKNVALKYDVGAMWAWDAAPEKSKGNCLATAVEPTGAVQPSPDTLSWFNTNSNGDHVRLGPVGEGMVLQLDTAYFRAVPNPLVGLPYSAMGKTGTGCVLAVYEPGTSGTDSDRSYAMSEPTPVDTVATDESGTPTVTTSEDGSASPEATTSATEEPSTTASSSPSSSSTEAPSGVLAAPVFDTYSFGV